ncbi:hypothetical protein [Teredinibacter turnerae]|uniref:hypothetical protein n=1 Tax=Teredinibacter turnerae TaxID=2426 RepID=UPI000375D10F|nr:hypothetical protein [Teredinibacter turnerae]
MGFFDKKSTNNNANDERNADFGGDNRVFEGADNAVIGGAVSVTGDSNVITDSGAIAGNIAIANNALETAKTISQDVGDRFNTGLQSISGLSNNFANVVETLKKTELTGGGSLFTDLLKWWPVIPVAVVAVVFIGKQGSRKNG